MGEALQQLIAYFVERGLAKPAKGGTQMAMRCHVCGDSINLSSAHLYVGELPNCPLIVYHCFRCGASGVVDGKFLREREIFEPVLTQALNENNRSTSVYTSNRNIRKKLKSFVPIIGAPKTDLNDKKLAYINRRLGGGIDYSNLHQYKIILDLKQYLADNGVTHYTRHPHDMDLIGQFFIGFLSSDNGFVNLRNLVIDHGKQFGIKDLDKRYINYNIYDQIDNSGKYFIIPSKIDTFQKVSVHITEGSFDILSVALNVRGNEPNSLMMSAQGKQYLSSIRYLFERFGFINFEVHLYPDSDMKPWELDRVLEVLAPLQTPLYIHRNQGEKDFGVPPERIHEIIQRIQ